MLRKICAARGRCRRRRKDFYDPKASMMPAASASSPTLRAARATTSSRTACKSWSTSTHRGAVGADPLAGDGAGMLVQIPHEFFAADAARLGFSLPEPGHYGVGQLFMPREPRRSASTARPSSSAWSSRGAGSCSAGATCRPTIRLGAERDRVRADATGRCSSAAAPTSPMRTTFERRLYMLRKVISNTIYGDTGGRDIGFYTVSMSCRTLVYKGMFLAYQLGAYYPDLHHPRFTSALALVHQRFSTNTFPSWKLAHPYRMVAHNGEINTLRGNVNWMAARQASVSSPLFGNDISKLWPISYEGQSDTACFDNALEFLVQGGYSLAARHDDADPRGLGRQSADGCEAPRLLRVSCLPDGAVGRSRRHGLHRRPPDRRHARPQRPAPRPLFRHRRRPRGHGLRNGRAARPREEHRAEMAPPAGQDAAHRPRKGPHRLR